MNTKNINFKILSVGVVIYALIIIIIKQPTISKANYAINTIRNFTLTHQNSSFAIYFEDEIYTFNMPGIRVMFQEYSIFKNIFIDYQFINSGPSSHLQDCIIPEFQKDWLLVFTANPEKRNGNTYNNFIKECPSEFRQKYEYQQTEEAFDGKTQIFKRIVDKNSKTNK